MSTLSILTDSVDPDKLLKKPKLNKRSSILLYQATNDLALKSLLENINLILISFFYKILRFHDKHFFL